MPIRPEIQIAMRLYFSKEGKKRTSRPAVRVALAGIMVGVLVMILTMCVVIGFKETVTQKIAGFGAHIQLVSFDNNNTYDMQPIEVDDSLLCQLQSYPYVQAVAPFITKPGMIKTDSAFHGIVLKGTDYWDFFAKNIVEGTIPQTTQEVIISNSVLNRLDLQIGDAINAYFVDESTVRARKWKIVGVYQTGFEQFDQLFIIAPLEATRRLQGWEEKTYSGVEVLLSDVNHLDEVADEMYFDVVNRVDENGYKIYYIQTLHQQNPAVFAWLDLLNTNVVVIIILMLLVAGFNIISGLIILIMESVQLIGSVIKWNNSFHYWHHSH